MVAPEDASGDAGALVTAFVALAGFPSADAALILDALILDALTSLAEDFVPEAFAATRFADAGADAGRSATASERCLDAVLAIVVVFFDTAAGFDATGGLEVPCFTLAWCWSAFIPSLDSGFEADAADLERLRERSVVLSPITLLPIALSPMDAASAVERLILAFVCLILAVERSVLVESLPAADDDRAAGGDASLAFRLRDAAAAFAFGGIDKLLLIGRAP